MANTADAQLVFKRRLGVRFLVVVLLAFFSCLLGVQFLAQLWVRADSYLKPAPTDFHHTKPMAGDLAPDFSLRDLQGNVFQLSERIGRRPMIIEFGSLN